MMLRTLLILLSLLLLSGCQDHKVLEKLGVILATSFDTVTTKTGENAFKISIAIPTTKEGKQIFLSTVAKSKKDADLALTRENDYELVNGQLRLILFSKEYAKLGLNNQLDTFVRDPSIGGKVKLIVVDGDAGGLLNSPTTQYDQATSLFLNSLLESTTKTRMIPLVDIFTFTRDFYDDGIDPVIPILKATPQKIQVSGIGLFKDAHYVAQLDPADFPVFSMLRGAFSGGNIVMKVNEDAGEPMEIGLFHISGKRNVKVTLHHPIQTGDDVKIRIELHLKGAITEHTGSLDLNNPNNQEKLESLMNNYLNKEMKKVIRSFQKNKVDPLGLGKFVRLKTSYPEWKANDWNNIFETAEITVNTHVKINNYGKMQELG